MVNACFGMLMASEILEIGSRYRQLRYKFYERILRYLGVGQGVLICSEVAPMCK